MKQKKMSHILASVEIPKGLIPTLQRGLLFVISAPAGAGKSSLAAELISYFPSLRLCVSCTTRAPRRGEQDGIDYHFMSKEEFVTRRDREDFLEWTEIHGHFYGSLRKEIEDVRAQGFHAMMVIDVDGAQQIRKLLDPVMIFIVPPSMEVLKERMEKRKSESEETLKKRLERARREMEYCKYYDYSVVNDDFLVALMSLVCIISGEIQKKKGYMHEADLFTV